MRRINLRIKSFTKIYSPCLYRNFRTHRPGQCAVGFQPGLIIGKKIDVSGGMSSRKTLRLLETVSRFSHHKSLTRYGSMIWGWGPVANSFVRFGHPDAGCLPISHQRRIGMVASASMLHRPVLRRNCDYSNLVSEKLRKMGW